MCIRDRRSSWEAAWGLSEKEKARGAQIEGPSGRNSNVLTRETEGWVFLFNTSTNELFRVNSTGGRIWDCLLYTSLSLFSPLLGAVVYSLVSFPLDAWVVVILAYTYLTYGPSSIPAATSPEILVPGVIPPPPMNQQLPQVGSATSASEPANFCLSLIHI